MTRFFTMQTGDMPPEDSAPNPEKVISGTPRFKLWALEDLGDGVSAGIWEATPGTWRFTSDHWEYCRILSGRSVITEDGGDPCEVTAGDSFILRAGFTGTWSVIETTRKDYVARD